MSILFVSCRSSRLSNLTGKFKLDTCNHSCWRRSTSLDNWTYLSGKCSQILNPSLTVFADTTVKYMPNSDCISVAFNVVSVLFSDYSGLHAKEMLSVRQGPLCRFSVIFQLQ